MKTFVIICLIFLLMIAVMIGNAAYVNRTVEDLISTLHLIDSSASDPTTAIEEMSLKWEKEKTFIQISVPHTKIDTVSDLITSLIIYDRYQNQTEYKKTAKLLNRALEELRLPEKISAVNIF